MRLDIYLTLKHDIQSRNKACELIKAEKVKINDKIITKPSFKVTTDLDEIIILDTIIYVSRSANKLKYFLEYLPQLNLKDKVALDIGSSTGGFTQVLLENMIKSIDCVDVGSNQLSKVFRNNNKINVFENTDIRNFTTKLKYEIIVCDVSFISITYIMENINKLSAGYIIILFKPQFEVGKNVKRDQNGVVIDKAAIEKSRSIFILESIRLNWKLILNKESEVSGKKGNIEELFCFKK